jgi:hypothetical protein
MRFNASSSGIEVFVKEEEFLKLRRKTKEGLSENALRVENEKGQVLYLCHSAHNIFKLGTEPEQGVQYFPPVPLVSKTDEAFLLNMETHVHHAVEKEGRYEVTLKDGKRVAIALEG